MNQDAKDKLNKIQELLSQKEKIEKELENLLTEKEYIMPAGFSVNDEILSLIREAGDSGIPVPELVKKLQTKFPSYGIDRERIASSLAYLKNTKKLIEQPARRVYRIIKTEQNT